MQSTGNTEGGAVLYQVSVLQTLARGDYAGSVPVTALSRWGDTGFGTFHGADGELTMLDGVIYRTAGDGSVTVVSGKESTPFANVAFFRPEGAADLPAAASLADLEALLDAQLPAAGRNYIRMVRLEGRFAAMTVRSELGQEPPYRPLTEMMAADERIFSYEDLTGTLVGLCCPPFLGGGLNIPGWHFHFLSADRTRGGHVRELSLTAARLTWCHLRQFRLLLPDTPTFTGMDLGE